MLLTFGTGMGLKFTCLYLPRFRITTTKDCYYKSSPFRAVDAEFTASCMVPPTANIYRSRSVSVKALIKIDLAIVSTSIRCSNSAEGIDS